MKEQQSNIEIADVENYRGDKLQVFNHQILVMEVLRRVNEAGSHELRPGWINEKMSPNGNVTKSYVEDTRKKFIECIQTAMMTMACDYDNEARNYIKRCLKELKEEKERLLKAQWKWYIHLAPKYKIEYTGSISQVAFNRDLGWCLKYIEVEVECYRAIGEELNSLTKRLDFYQTADFEA